MRIRLPAIIVAAAALHGCAAVGPNYQPPEVATPDAWQLAVAEQLEPGTVSTLQAWWTVFDDPVLTDLIERTRRDNLDLQIAVSRVREARAQLAVASGEKMPVIEGSGSLAATKMSDDGPLGQIAPEDGFSAHGLISLGIDAAWEIDVFGRVRRTIEAAGAAYDASIEDQRDVMVTLFAEVALAYADLRGMQQRIVIARDNADAQAEILTLTEDLFNDGITSRLDVAQARSTLAGTRAQIPLFEVGLQQARNRLAVLIGETPEALQSELEQTGAIPAPTESVDAGVPADVLRQRPDIRAAERQIAAQTALVGVATADLYPTFGLSGFFGMQARSFNSNPLTFGVSSPVQMNLFDRDSIRSNIVVQEEVTQQALLYYQNAVLRAIAEVDNAIGSYNQYRARSELLRQAVEASRDALDLVKIQYTTGVTDFNNVLDTERLLYQQEDQLVATEVNVAFSLIALYKALGGGWDFAAAPGE